MDLSVYLTELLKKNDCVIIPDLGGFIANFQSARYDEQGEQFFPPSREIIFSAKLKKNDGLLVNHVADREKVGYLEARKMVSEFVAECMYRLENGEAVDFDQIGTLRFDQQENLLFDATQQNTIRTDTFGLDALHFPQLLNKYIHAPKPVFRDQAPVAMPHRRPVLKYVLFGLPLLGLLYFVPYNQLMSRYKLIRQPAQNTASLIVADSPAPHKAEVAPEPSVRPDGSSATSIAPANVPAPEKSVALQANGTNPVAEPGIAANKEPETVPPMAQTVVNNSPKGKFHVVGGCFKIRENADKLAERLVQKGYPAEVSNFGKDLFRVSVQSFQTRKEAEDVLGKLLEAEPDYGYWLMADRH